MKDKKNKVIIKNKSIKALKLFLNKSKFNTIFVVRGNKSFKNSEAEKEIKLMNNDFNFIFFNKFSSNPKYTDALLGAKIFIEQKCDCIISVGGGSTIDMGKLINVFQSHKSIEKDIIFGIKKITRKLKPFIAIPTTAGSGSECTHFAVVYLKEKKYSIANKKLVPDLALVDYSLTLKLSRYQTACSGMDALSQAIESYWSVRSNIESRKYARKSIKLILNNLLDCVNNPSQISRKNMMEASHLAGKAINITKTTAPHALSYKISQLFKIPHGHAVALTLGYFFELNHYGSDINGPRDKTQLKKIMSQIYKYFDASSPKDSKNKWLKLMNDLGLENNFNKFFGNDNLNKSLKIEYIKYIVKSINIERLKNHPVKLSNKQLENIFF
jgi:alcohol dehydrogenase class IV